MFFNFILIITLFFTTKLVFATDIPTYPDKIPPMKIIRGKSTNLPLPRFVSLKYNKTNMRSGPGKEYAILWVYQKKGLPVQIINEFEHWRRIRDLDGSEGWVHQSIISGKRMIVTLEGAHNVYEKPDLSSDVVAKVDGNIIATPTRCNDTFCYIVHEKFSGWLPKNILYGVANDETLGKFK